MGQQGLWTVEETVVTGMQQSTGAWSCFQNTSAEAGVGCHGQAVMETLPNGKKRWLGDLKDKSLHRVVLFIQDYNYNFLHIILQEQR